jgi:hypothetical protein
VNGMKNHPKVFHCIDCNRNFKTKAALVVHETMSKVHTGGSVHADPGIREKLLAARVIVQAQLDRLTEQRKALDVALELF